jgi:hypothetical protein
VTGLVGMIKIVEPSACFTMVEAIVHASGNQYPNWDQWMGFGVVKSDLALDLLSGEGVQQRTVSAGSPTTWYDTGRSQLPTHRLR